MNGRAAMHSTAMAQKPPAPRSGQIGRSLAEGAKVWEKFRARNVEWQLGPCRSLTGYVMGIEILPYWHRVHDRALRDTLRSAVVAIAGAVALWCLVGIAVAGQSVERQLGAVLGHLPLKAFFGAGFKLGARLGKLRQTLFAARQFLRDRHAIRHISSLRQRLAEQAAHWRRRRLSEETEK
jgi:hypothetical protein